MRRLERKLALDDERNGPAFERGLRKRMAVDARAAQRNVERAGKRFARVRHDGVDARRQRPHDARVAEHAEHADRPLHHACLFGAAGITPACSIAARASVRNTGAATTPP